MIFFFLNLIKNWFLNDNNFLSAFDCYEKLKFICIKTKDNKKLKCKENQTTNDNSKSMNQ